MKMTLLLAIALFSGLVTGCGISDGPSLKGAKAPAGDVNLGTLSDLQYLGRNGTMYIADSSNQVIRKVVNGTITTVAGIGGSPGSTGDGGLATSAKFNDPTSVVVDASGTNLYVADYNNNAVRKINLSSGIITTVAGTIGVGGSTGDGGLATSAKLNNPVAVGLDGVGNLYISDTANCAVRKVDAVSGIITTVVGTIASCGATGDNGLATSAQIQGYADMTVDTAGNIYVADYENGAIRKVPVSTGIITTIAGTLGTNGHSPDGTLATSAQLSYPAMGSVDSAGNVYFLENCSTVRKIDVLTGNLVTLAGTDNIDGSTGDGGLATAALMNCPSFTAFDTAGNLYVADTGNSTIRMINASGIISRVVGTIGNFSFSGDGGPATSATLNDVFDYTY